MATVYLTIRPNEQKITHRWKTSIQKTVKGKEKRSALFTWPRIALNQTLHAVGSRQINWLKRQLTNNIDDIWAIPVWADESELVVEAASGQPILDVDEVDYRHFYDNCFCIVMDPDDCFSYEVGSINLVSSGTITLDANLTSTWPVGSLVFPIYECRIAQGQTITAEYDFYQEIEIQADEAFEEERNYLYTIPTSTATTYSGIDVFDYEFLAPIEYSFQRNYDLLQFLGVGYAYKRYDAGENELALKAVVTSNTKETTWNVLQFFDSKQGQFMPLWVPTWGKDLVPTLAIGAADTLISIENIEYTTQYLPNDVINRHVFIRFPDGTYVCRKIISSSAMTITLNSAIGTSVSASNLSKMRISFLYFCRFTIDSMEIEYVSSRGDVANIECSFKVLLEESI